MRLNEFHRGRTFLAVLAVLAGLGAVALVGGGGEATSEKVEPYELTAVDEDRNLVVLTPKASERLVMETAPVTEESVDGRSMLTVPYAALIYDTSGGTWVYVQPEPLTYLRSAVSVDWIEGDRVYLTDGPAPGTEVAVTSVAELYGTDTGVGK